MNPANELPDFYKDYDGQVSLDIKERTKIAIARVIDDFIEAGSIKQDSFKEIELPISKKNRLILGNVGNPTALNQNHNKIFDIQLLKDDDYSYPVQGLQVFNVSDQGDAYICTIFGELNDWYRPLKNTKLNELELGSVVVSDANYNTINNDAGYIDGGQPFRTPLVNYGRWYVQNNKAAQSEARAQVVFNNFRPWFSAKAVMEQMFCQVGYELIAPFMDTDTFRQLFMYILDPNFETANQADIGNRPFEAERTADNNQFIALFAGNSVGKKLIGVLNFGDGTGTSSITDLGSHYLFNSNATGAPLSDFYGSFYTSSVIANFSFEGTIRFTPTNSPSTFIPISPNYITIKVSIRKVNKFGIESQEELIENSTELISKTIIDKGSFINGVVKDYEFKLNTEEMKVYQHEAVFVFVEHLADLTDTSGNLYDQTFMHPDMKFAVGGGVPNTRFTVSPVSQVIEEGDTIDLGLLLHSEKTCAELFKGIAHLYNFKIETDSISKTVSMYPEFKTDLNTEGEQEGFFKPNQDDVFDATDKIQAGSMIEKTKPNELGRDVYLKFLDSTDGYISGLNLTDELHSKRIDLGSDFADRENVLENPFFAPLANAIDGDIGNLEILTGFYTGEPSANYIPFMWESEDTDGIYPDVGFDYTPRIGIFLGNVALFAEPSITGFDNDTQCDYIYEDVGRVFISSLAQIYPAAVGIDLLGTKVAVEKAVVYGNGVNPLVQDLYELIYERSINQAYFTPSLEFLVKLSLLDFSNLSFRRKWRLKYDSLAWGEIEVYTRIARVSDFLINGNITTPVELIPDNNNFDKC